MCSFGKSFAAATTLGLTLCGIAQAADLGRGYPPLPPPVEAPPLPVSEFASGWYLRGDLGYRQNKVDNVTNEGVLPILDDDLGKSWLVGVGAGMQWQWLRSDFTFDYGTRAKYRADTAAGADDFTADIDSFSALANLYGDLGTWYGFTPYIGAGAGIAHLNVSKFEEASLGSTGTTPSGSKWNPAWAYMAGVSYALSPRFNLDVGYRHINMGNVSSGMDTVGNQLKFHDVAADEIRLGVRYHID
ncbi:MAG TPA: outer membrane protein [Xanthobacteraceae bacterium]|nr:outer membrane protein [Xanthobacteraceae bacterium]